MRSVPLFTALLVAAALLGCGERVGDHDGHDHPVAGSGAHVHVAPHGGTLVVLAEEGLHLEFLHDPAEKRLTCFVLGAHADTPVRIEQETLAVEIRYDAPDGAPDGSGAAVRQLELRAVANQLTGETVGDTSQFETTDDALAGLAAFGAVLSVVDVRGRRFTDVGFRVGGE